ncbi:MAG: ATP-binding protein [Fibrobacterales bacterium]
MDSCAVIKIDDEQCVNCHQCIQSCPVKFCNDGSGDHIAINNDLCIQCGSCLKVCTHSARIAVDDCESAMEALAAGKKMVAIVAPAAAACFGDEHLRLNGWLTAKGIDAVFDVSFGAELTVKSNLEHLKKSGQKCMISQACPTLVNYVQLYRPELIPYLAPADSPMVHTVKMIREFYPQFEEHGIFIVSPCIAKGQEFLEAGIEAYNVTLVSILQNIEREGVDLKSFEEREFDNCSAERAVMFSSPGGLLYTAMRDNPEIYDKARVIEGDRVFRYLDQLSGTIDKGSAPVLVDCLNCELGCNGGTGTLDYGDGQQDELEERLIRRKEKMVARYMAESEGEEQKKGESAREAIHKYWKDGLYTRTYRDRSAVLNNIIHPNQSEITEIYHAMMKFSEADIKNCSSCGYNSCESMATAVHNKLNRPDNCHFYLQKKAANDILDSVDAGVMLIDPYTHAIVQANTTALRMMGRGWSEVKGHECHNFLCPTQRGNCPVVTKEKAFERKERVMLTADGEKVPIIKSVRWITIDGKDLLLESFIDITERKFAENELVAKKEKLEASELKLKDSLEKLQSAQKMLIQSEKMASLGELVAGVAHEINTPVGMALTGVSHVHAETEKIRDEYQSDSMTEERFISYLENSSVLNESVVINLKKAAELVQSFKQVAVDQSNELPRVFGLKQLVKEVIISLQSELKKTTLNIEIKIADTLNISSVPGAFSQILTNLIINSLNHGFEGQADGTINIAADLSDGELQITYQDDGKGMDEVTQEKVFDPFYTTKRNAGGTGLGMNIVFNLVSAKLNGTIRCESELGSGVLFHITVPVSVDKKQG